VKRHPYEIEYGTPVILNLNNTDYDLEVVEQGISVTASSAMAWIT